VTNFSHNFAGAGAVIADSVTVTGTVTAAALVGPLTGDTTGTHYGPVDTDNLTVDGVVVIAAPPNTNAEFEAATGFTSAAWWRLDRMVAAGTLASLGDTAATLTSAGTPTFGAELVGADGASLRGIHFDASTLDTLAADVLDPASNSFMFGGRLGFASDPAGTGHTLAGRCKLSGGTIWGWQLYVTDAGDLKLWIGDGNVAHTQDVTLAAALLSVGGPPVEAVLQLDRTGADPIARVRWSRNGRTIGSSSTTCTSLGTLSSTAQEFGFGPVPTAAPLYNGGSWAQWGWCVIGAEAEGASKAQTVAQGLGWEQ
jgi:hypothetical protein